MLLHFQVYEVFPPSFKRFFKRYSSWYKVHFTVAASLFFVCSVYPNDHLVLCRIHYINYLVSRGSLIRSPAVIKGFFLPIAYMALIEYVQYAQSHFLIFKHRLCSDYLLLPVCVSLLRHHQLLGGHIYSPH